VDEDEDESGDRDAWLWLSAILSVGLVVLAAVALI
jgi:hypothetical protein